MRVLVVGSGGREHALAWKLAQEHGVIVTPGNPGIGDDCELASVAASDSEGIARLCADRAIDLVVVGPEDPLIAGLADFLRERRITVYGPGADGARLEGSKAFSKHLMEAAAVPTAEFETFTSATAAIDYARHRTQGGRGVAVKASGNALGKGVVLANDAASAQEAIERMMVHREFGDAGSTVVVEDRLIGPEFSLMTIVGEHNCISLPVAQDHKRVFDGDAGPNTGGMGAYSPVAWVTDELVAQTEARIVRPVLGRLAKLGIPFRGTLFSGVLVEDGVPYCLEYNVRFGDPETQALMMRIGRGLGETLYQAAAGEVVMPPGILDNAVASVVVASGGYPGTYSKGMPIDLGRMPAGVKVFHAGTALDKGRLVTSGGRALAVTAAAATLHEAVRLAYEGVHAVRFDGMQFRSDIGTGGR